MTDHKKLTLSQCAELIESIKSPVIMMHARPDGDTVASAVALYRIFEKLGVEGKLLSSDPIPERLRYLTEGIPFTDRGGLSGTLITVDIASRAQAGAFGDLLDNARLMIDHHTVGDPFCDNFIVAGESSCAEVIMRIAELFESEGKIKMDEILASTLYSGISSDTGSFRYSNTSPDTMRRAARLMEFGIDHADINHKLFSTKSMKEIKAEGMVSEKINTAFDGKVAYCVIELSDMKKIDAQFSDFECAVDVVRTVRGALISFVVKELKSGEYRVSLRSVSPNVANVAANFGGGGHIRASGCSVVANSGDDCARLVLDAINEFCFK